jgi:filamentous hemagglutinin family protein
MKISLADIVCAGYLLMCMPAHAQITPDSSLQTITTVTSSGNLLEISDGTKAGVNLFHSFYNFSVAENDTIRFINNDSSIQNIISRVTRASSEILGNIEAGGSSPNFNLFLINPKGIMFGPNAKLDIGGSFFATTSNAIQFGNQGFLETSTPNDPSLLTINPTAFFFDQIRPQPITSQALMTVSNGNSILLLGGDIRLNGASLNALNGHIELDSVTESGLLELNASGRIFDLNFPAGLMRGNVVITNGATVDVTDKGSGSISINAQNIELSEKSNLYAGINSKNTSDTSTPGAIVLNASGKITLSDTLAEVQPEPDDFLPHSYIDNSALKKSIGKAGDISITAESLILKNAVGITTTVGGVGNAGNIDINIKNELVLAGSDITGRPSQISSGVENSGEGNSGNLTVNAGSISLSDGALIRSSVLFGRGNTGNISIHADDFISINDSGKYTTQIRTAVEAGSIGTAGNIDIRARSLSLTSGGQLSSAIVGPEDGFPGGEGKGGNINIYTSDSITISGVGVDGLFSGIFTNTEEGAYGPAGNIFIKTNSLKISDGAKVKLSNLQAQAGNLEINASFLILDNGNIIAETAGNSANDNANINLNLSGILRIENESLISAKAADEANGGNIKINVPILLALSPTGFEGSDIRANAQSGVGGNITINAQGIFGLEQRTANLRDQTNDIDASSQFGQSGQVQINTTTDPNQGLVELPSLVVDPNTLVAQNPCKRSSKSEFTHSGRGGLPPSLSQDLNGETTQISLVEPAALNAAMPYLKQAPTKEASSLPLSSSQIVPAQGWVYNNKGEVVLVAYNSAITGPQRLQSTPAGCLVL